MIGDWLLEIAKGTGRMFLNPLLYWFLLLLFLDSLRRIKKERRLFGTKVFGLFAETKNTWPISLFGGLTISIMMIGSGIVFNPTVVLTLSCVMIMITFISRFAFASPAYPVVVTYLLLLTFPFIGGGDLANLLLPSLEATNITSLAFLLGILFIVESMLFFRIKPLETFPEVIKGNRGKWVGRHRLKKLVFLPFFTLVPTGLIEPFASWWPLLEINGSSYGLTVIPWLIGLEQTVKGIAPVRASKRLGQAVLVLGLVTLGIAAGSYYMTDLAIVSIGTGFVGRVLITYLFWLKDKQKTPYFYPASAGVLILGIAQGTPAERLKLLPGEHIEKVNGQRVSNEQEFYEALQKNSAYCKLEVRDEQGEIRFTQRAMYQGDPHELGVVLAKQQYRWKSKKEKSG